MYNNSDPSKWHFNELYFAYCAFCQHKCMKLYTVVILCIVCILYVHTRMLVYVSVCFVCHCIDICLKSTCSESLCESVCVCVFVLIRLFYVLYFLCICV